MVDRRVQGARWESWIDRQIREAEERGEFDNLPGAGKPLPDLDQPRDDLWWVKKLMKRENLSITPPALEVRKAREDALEGIARARSEDEVRRIVAQINARITDLNAKATTGPPSNVAPLDTESVVAQWRRRHP